MNQASPSYKLKVCIKKSIPAYYFNHHHCLFCCSFKKFSVWCAVDISHVSLPESSISHIEPQHGKHSLCTNFKHHSCCAATLHQPAHSFIRTAYILILINSELDEHANTLPVVFIIAAFSIPESEPHTLSWWECSLTGSLASIHLVLFV